jgi:glyoxylase-like metal-dependent hydrolase (beta-lactamase superfamily II)
MNPLESQLEYVFGDTLPPPGTVHQITPGLFWIRMSLPFALDHINLWLVRDEFDAGAGPQQGWTVIDCGVATDATRAAWETIFAESLQGLPIVRVIATHYHPDHLGLAEWLCTRWNVPLWMTTGEYAFARMVGAGLPGANGAAMVTYFQRHGVNDPDMLVKLQARVNHYSKLVPSIPQAYHAIRDGQTLRIGTHDWRIITGFGHSPEHASLYCAEQKVLISGDMVLPRISTNVSVPAIEPEANPVQLYLDSLAKFRHLPDDVLVLPSHGKPFRGVHTRVGQLADHHHERLAEVVAACATPLTAADIVPIMFRRTLDAHQLSFALGEALAHLHKLWYDRVLLRETDADGVIRFKTI